MQNSRTLSDWIIEQATDAIIYADRSETIQRWNATAEVLFGHSAPEVIGSNLDLIIPERLHAAYWRGFCNHERHDGSARLRHADPRGAQDGAQALRRDDFCTGP